MLMSERLELDKAQYAKRLMERLGFDFSDSEAIAGSAYKEQIAFHRDFEAWMVKFQATATLQSTTGGENARKETSESFQGSH